MSRAVVVRRLEAHEWRRYREVRLVALEQDPDSFGQRYVEEASAPGDRWAAFVARATEGDSTILVAEADGSIVGIASAGLRDESADMWIGGMWVRPEHRGRAIGASLLDTALSWGRSAGATRARLAVTTGNRAAERLYQSAGFQPTGETGTLYPGSQVGITWMERAL